MRTVLYMVMSPRAAAAFAAADLGVVGSVDIAVTDRA
jgi:hypothetical protein